MSSERENEINGFLQKHGWGEALQMPFAGDFSPRRYIRLTQPDGAKAILMDADPGQKTGCFVELAEYLHAIGIRVPKLFAEDGDHGLVLMEDLGKRNCGKLLDSNAIDAGDFYRRATDVLVELHAHFDKAKAAQLDLPVFGGALFSLREKARCDAGRIPYLSGGVERGFARYRKPAADIAAARLHAG
jgi:aminoglycoside/choline kinase family phosphotransferase